MIAKVSCFGPTDEDRDRRGLLSPAVTSFLVADVGVESNGMMLSVLSMLSRQNVDPWEEASHLARLPRREATHRLAQRIAAMPGSLWPHAQATAVASGLVILLPAHASPAARMIAPRMRNRPSWLDRLSAKTLPRSASARQPKMARLEKLFHLYLALAFLVTVLAGLALHATKNETTASPKPAPTQTAAPQVSQLRFR